MLARSSSHNRRIIQPTSNKHECNSRNRAKCPLENKCLTANIVYKAVVSAPSKPEKEYFAIGETSFKDRFRNHTRDFRHKPSPYMWKLKDKNTIVNIKWNILSIIYGTPKGGACKLYLTEKSWLLKHFHNEHLFNKKSEFISKCKHENKLLVNQQKRGSFIYVAVSF